MGTAQRVFVVVVVAALKSTQNTTQAKNKTKHMKISHINENIHDKLQQVNKIVIKMLNKHEN